MASGQAMIGEAARVVHVGVDGTAGRWVAVGTDRGGAFAAACLVDRLAEVLGMFAAAEAVAIDVPMGLTRGEAPGSPPREADVAAKAALGPRGSTVFPMPPREVLEAATYAEARALSRELTGKGLSAQSYALRHNVLEADGLRRDPRVFEVHPELSFMELAGRSVLTKKRSWNGAMERAALLEGAGLDLPPDLEGVGAVPVDDLLDAGICAWTARRIALGLARSFPEDPSLDELGRPMAIWA